MKLFSTLVLIGAMLFAGAAQADHHEKSEDAKKKEEMMKAWQEYATPSDGHKILRSMAGQWSYKSKYWEKADAQPHESKGTASMRMILGGRYLEGNVKGKTMGMPFEGRSLLGYDNLKKKYESTWIDNMGTGHMRSEGKFDAAENALKEEGDFMCPIAKEKLEFRSEWKILDKNTMIFSMWGEGPDGGDEYKQMEMTFKRM